MYARLMARTCLLLGFLCRENGEFGLLVLGRIVRDLGGIEVEGLRAS